MLQKLFFTFLLGCFVTTIGCGQSDSTAEAPAAKGEDFLSDFLKEIDLAEAPLPEKIPEATPGETEATEVAEDNDVLTVAASTEMESNAGAVVTADATAVAPSVTRRTFSLLKTVEQTLVQKSPAPASAKTRVQTWITLRVVDTNPQETTLAVNYDRVAYHHDINGQQLTYDSRSPVQPVPLEAQAYAGLVNNGFQFQVDSSRRITRVSGYDVFLQKWGARIHDSIKLQTLTSMQDQSQAVSRFVDETFGLFQESEDAQVGKTWQQPQTVTTNPLTKVDMRCRLLALNENEAEVDLSGTYQPAVALPNVNGVQINQCRTLGTCRIDRATGVPVKLNRSLYVTMSLTTVDGQVVPQEKRIQTTIELQNSSSSRAIVPVAGTALAPEISKARSAVSQRTGNTSSPTQTGQNPVSAPLGSTARAVYPD